LNARLLGLVGTDTEVGKTVVTAGLALALRPRGWRVAAIKPVATGVAPGESGEDAELLAQATDADARDCLGVGFRLPRSPLAAAQAEGAKVDVDQLVAWVRQRAEAPEVDLLLVEPTGGLNVPITSEVTMGGFFRRLAAPVVIVGRAGLGTINHTTLTIDACRNLGLPVLGVILSDGQGTEPAFAAENAAEIARQSGVPVLGILPHLEIPHDSEALGQAVKAALELPTLEHLIRRPLVEAEEITRLDHAHAWHPFTQTAEWKEETPLVIVRGEGSRLIDTEGRHYLDGIASYWANVHGHAHPKLDAALREQAGNLSHSTFLGQTHEPGVRLAAELAAIAPPPLQRVFFSDSGASAVEAGLRRALMAQRYMGQTRRTRFLSLENAYHGDTAGAVSVSQCDPFHRGLEPMLANNVLRWPPPHTLRLREGLSPKAAEAASLARLQDLLEEHGDTVAALVIEPRVQGPGGMLLHSDHWLREVAERARKHGALLLCDEVATGFGRTADLFACAGAGVTPDILALGKGITGGYLPLSATLVGDQLFDLFTGPYSEHRTLYYGHTYTANPLACKVARASLALFQEEDTLASARRLGRRLAERLSGISDLPHVAEVRQRGVMVGVELAEDGLEQPFDPALRIGRRVTLAARNRGVIVRPLGDVIVINPPLVMTDAEADSVVQALVESIQEIVPDLALAH
jgi:adenosylmethionine-8-amino-7-oxononanoate aminotransferase